MKVNDKFTDTKIFKYLFFYYLLKAAKSLLSIVKYAV